MIEETVLVTIYIKCDRAHCYRAARVQEPTREAANYKLYDLGWRVSNGKQVCPSHVELRRKRQASREQRS